LKIRRPAWLRQEARSGVLVHQERLHGGVTQRDVGEAGGVAQAPRSTPVLGAHRRSQCRWPPEGADEGIDVLDG
jgi:hypothetical protein